MRQRDLGRRLTTGGRGLVAACLAVASHFVSAEARAQSKAVVPSLTTERMVLERVCTTSPLRARASAVREEGVAGAKAAAVLPNPSVLVEHNRSFTGSEDTETISGIEFPLGIGGRRFLLADAAEQRVAQKKAEAEAILIDGALDAREALIAAVAESNRSALMTAQHDTLIGIAATIAGAQKSPSRSQHDLLRQTVEVELHATTLSLQNAKTAAANAGLAAFVDRPVDLATIQLSTMAEDGSKRSFATHPRILAFDASIRASDLEVDAANRRWVPDLDLFFGYREVTAFIAPDELQVGRGLTFRVGLPITFFDHGQGEAAIAAAQRSSTRAEREIFAATKRSEVKAANDVLTELTHVPAGVDTVALAKKLFEQDKDLYAAGEGSIEDLLEAAGLVESTALARIDAEEARANARVAKMRALGTLSNPELEAICAAGAK
ncbi:MAG: TolC family protein [Polyangiaceae bacterium]|nr:TolC family protein [Polyangiaceae bacterium]